MKFVSGICIIVNLVLLAFPYQVLSACTSGKSSTISRGVSSGDVNLIVNSHNNIRSYVANGNQKGQPAAANMRKMIWDQNIAAEAQKWADHLASQCLFQHGKYDGNAGGYGSLGQNLFSTTQGKLFSPDWNTTINAFYEEVTRFNPNNINPFKSQSGVGHYTQLVWADTYAVGCGYVQYSDGDRITGLSVCDYGPAGNVGGGTMYIVGQHCTKCPPGTKFCTNELCQL